MYPQQPHALDNSGSTNLHPHHPLPPNHHLHNHSHLSHSHHTHPPHPQSLPPPHNSHHSLPPLNTHPHHSHISHLPSHHTHHSHSLHNAHLDGTTPANAAPNTPYPPHHSTHHNAPPTPNTANAPHLSHHHASANNANTAALPPALQANGGPRDVSSVLYTLLQQAHQSGIAAVINTLGQKLGSTPTNTNAAALPEAIDPMTLADTILRNSSMLPPPPPTTTHTLNNNYNSNTSNSTTTNAHHPYNNYPLHSLGYPSSIPSAGSSSRASTSGSSATAPVPAAPVNPATAATPAVTTNITPATTVIGGTVMKLPPATIPPPGGKKRGGRYKPTSKLKHSVNESERRRRLRDKFHALAQLLNCPTSQGRINILSETLEKVTILKSRLEELERFKLEIRQAAGRCPNRKDPSPEFPLGQPCSCPMHAHLLNWNTVVTAADVAAAFESAKTRPKEEDADSSDSELEEDKQKNKGKTTDKAATSSNGSSSAPNPNSNASTGTATAAKAGKRKAVASEEGTSKRKINGPVLASKGGEPVVILPHVPQQILADGSVKVAEKSTLSYIPSHNPSLAHIFDETADGQELNVEEDDDQQSNTSNVSVVIDSEKAGDGTKSSTPDNKANNPSGSKRLLSVPGHDTPVETPSDISPNDFGSSSDSPVDEFVPEPVYVPLGDSSRSILSHTPCICVTLDGKIVDATNTVLHILPYRSLDDLFTQTIFTSTAQEQLLPTLNWMKDCLLGVRDMWETVRDWLDPRSHPILGSKDGSTTSTAEVNKNSIVLPPLVTHASGLQFFRLPSISMAIRPGGPLRGLISFWRDPNDGHIPHPPGMDEKTGRELLVSQLSDVFMPHQLEVLGNLMFQKKRENSLLAPASSASAALSTDVSSAASSSATSSSASASASSSSAASSSSSANPPDFGHSSNVSTSQAHSTPRHTSTSHVFSPGSYHMPSFSPVATPVLGVPATPSLHHDDHIDHHHHHHHVSPHTTNNAHKSNNS